MKAFTVDSSNHSISCALIDINENNILAVITVERIGLLNGKITINNGSEVIAEEQDYADHQEAITSLVDKLVSLNLLAKGEVSIIGHKVIRGPRIYKEPTLIDQKLLEELEELIEINALKIKAEVIAIKAFQEVFSEATAYAIFDSSFYSDIPVENYLYAVPYKWYQDFGVRKYGYHGLSHSYVNQEIKNIIGKDNYKLISCHLNKGVSISAILDGVCIDTSMGFTPLSGAMMSNCSGDIDPSIIPYIMQKEGKNAGEVIADLNYNSGLLGVSEFSEQISEIINQCNEGVEKALIAKNKYIREIVNYISDYYVLLEGADIITFTGEVGENYPLIREEICEKLACLNIKIDKELNNKNNYGEKINEESSKTDIYVINSDPHLLLWNELKKV